MRRIRISESQIRYFDWQGTVDEYCEEFGDEPCDVEKLDFMLDNVMLVQRVPREFHKRIMDASAIDHGWREAA